ncbi:type VI immunity family protein [Rubrivivax gelatinosus]|uniref:type VI immunity family protein n=1 Tax=Rubrivivax gelatinosus TaxID=28068 RepID=UPI001E2C6777|nr:type VI immunity family protein [Rubrivivax gelatinosus]
MGSLFDHEFVNSYAVALRDWPAAEVNHGDFVLSPTVFTTLYFHYPDKHASKAAVSLVHLFDNFERLVDARFKLETHPKTERPHPYGSKKLPPRLEWAQKCPETKNFLFEVSDELNTASSPSVYAQLWRSSSWTAGQNNAYSFAQFYIGLNWLGRNKEAWRGFIASAAERLCADQIYAGLAFANPMDTGCRYEVAAWERALAPHFLGLDIDFPLSMARTLQDGIRPPTWAFLLSDHWRSKLGLTRAQVRAALDDPRIRVDDLGCGQWIELGDKPDLLPVENGVPELQMRLNRLLKPIRNDDLGLVGFGQWDGDPNVRFDRADSRRWLARFDDDSDWPDAATRRATTPVVARPGSVLAKSTCTRSGWWFSPAQAGSRRHFQQGDVMPELGGDYGTTIWQWDDKQDP